MSARRALKQRLVGTRLEGPLRSLRVAFKDESCRQAVRYDTETFEVIRRVVGPTSNCIDVGAAVGGILQNIVAAAPHGRHLAVEPLPENTASLRARFPDVEIVEAALDDTQGESSFERVDASTGYSGLIRRVDLAHDIKSTTITVRRAKLDDLVPEDRPIRFIKIDVEGAELRVLRGSRRILESDRPYVVFECGPAGCATYSTAPGDVFDLLASCRLELSLMKRWLAGTPPFTREEFLALFATRTEYYWIAYPGTGLADGESSA